MSDSTAPSNFEMRTVDEVRHGHVLPRSMGGGSRQVATCRACGAEAKALHNQTECHTCRDWNGCGTDCTLSGWTCEACGITEEPMRSS